MSDVLARPRKRAAVKPATVPETQEWRNLYFHKRGTKIWGLYIWPTQNIAVRVHQKWFRDYWAAGGGAEPNPALWAIAFPWPKYVEGARFQYEGFDWNDVWD